MSEKQKHDKPRCGVVYKGRPPCKQVAGWGTDHPGEGACKNHGGASKGAPKGNSRAVATGEFQAIWLDQLEPDEVAAIGNIKTDKLAQVEQEIVIAEIRERRMLERIAKLKAKGDLSIVETIDEQGTAVTGDGAQVPVNRSIVKAESTLNQIQRIEDALTRVQEAKRKLIELKHKIETDAKGDSGQDDGLQALADALRKSREAQDG